MDGDLDSWSQQRVAHRRNQILDAATRVFAAKGYHQATIRAVAREAGVADGTIYNYFAGKEDLLLGLLDRLNESEDRPVQLPIEPGSAEDLPAFLAAYLAHRLDVVWPNAPLFRAVLPELLVNETLRSRYREQVLAPTLALGEAFLAGQIAGGQIRSVDPALAVRAIAGSVFGLLLLQLLGDELLPARQGELAPALADLFWRALSPDATAAADD